MNLTNSLLRDLMTEYVKLRPQIYFNSALNALVRAMQDLVLASNDRHLVIANFQQESFFRSSANRFQRIAQKENQVYVLGVPDTESSFAVDNSDYETIPLNSTDTLAGERYLVIVGQGYSACLVMRERLSLRELEEANDKVEEGQRFEGIWTFDLDVARSAADWLLGRIKNYRPELGSKTEQARKHFCLREPIDKNQLLWTSQSVDLGAFTQRLVTYIQAGQYKLIKAYKAIATAEKKEQLISKIAAAQRSSLDTAEILTTTVEELGRLFPNCRCLLYRLDSGETEVTIEYESTPKSMPSLLGQQWSVIDNPIFLVAQTQNSALVINNVTDNIYLLENPILRQKVKQAAIRSWLMVPIRYQEQLLGVLEIHYGGGGTEKFQWKPEDVALVEAVATSTAAALTQASAYNNLVELNSQLAAVERIQSNLIAIVGHELRTPLSTIRICLESLATEPKIPTEMKNIMLDTALNDTDRLEQLIQNFLTLSKLEAGKAYRNIESLTLDYALNLALRRIQTTDKIKILPKIRVEFPNELPPVLADVDGLVEVFIKLLDNACKFTPTSGEIIISTQRQNKAKIACQSDRQMLEIVITDTGRGIESDQLEVIFDRFSQSEGYLRRTVNGVGLGLVICRQIIKGMGGQIWAQSKGKDQGSQFHFTLPIEPQSLVDCA
ncbi:MAG: ATP-binding protein [Pleurocapsa sp. MO_192.B19]|nr:ATP-binding protein [Pleurocapsa sp. MO_192.B19]